MNFNELNIIDPILRALEEEKYESPTPIQEQAIPAVLAGRDLLGCAQTGTGKTAAFGVPMLQLLYGHPAAQPGFRPIRGLILTPTRELALQIYENLRAYGRHTGLRLGIVFGGVSQNPQVESLKRGVDILVATPGRLNDLIHQKYIDLHKIEIFVLDEADRMLDMGFIHDVRRILDIMPKVAQMAMFSATMSRSVMDISWIYQREAIEITVQEDELNKPPITQYSIDVNGNARIAVIRKLMQDNAYEKVIVFCNTKQMVESVNKQMKAAGMKADCIHGDVRQSTREKVLHNFRKGSLSILIATDVASRGLDIDGVDAVFNYEIPLENEHYTHRIGRTGRAKHAGVAYTFTNVIAQPRLDEIIRYTRTPIEALEISVVR